MMRLSTDQDPDNAANLRTVCTVLLNSSVHTAAVCAHCQNRKKYFTNHQQNILYTLYVSRRTHSRGHQIFHLQYSIQTGHTPPVTREATTYTSAILPNSLVAETGGCTLTLNTVINQLHHFLKINLNVILSPPVWSSMKLPTRIQITRSSLYAIRSVHHNLTALLQ